jgi:hypothetical protein
MASHEQIDRMGISSSSTSSDDGGDDDSSTSSDDSQDDEKVADAMSLDDSGSGGDDSDSSDSDSDVSDEDDEELSSNQSVSNKPRIKLNLRMSVSSAGSGGDRTSEGESEAANGSKRVHKADAPLPPKTVEVNKKPLPMPNPVSTVVPVAAEKSQTETKLEEKKTDTKPMQIDESEAKAEPEEPKSDIKSREVKIEAKPDSSKAQPEEQKKDIAMKVEEKTETAPKKETKDAPPVSETRAEKSNSDKAETDTPMAETAYETTKTDGKAKPKKPESVVSANGTTKPSPFTLPSAGGGSSTGGPPKKKMFKKLARGLPLATNRKPKPEGDSAVKATVVDGNERAENDVVATALDDPTKVKKAKSSKLSATGKNKAQTMTKDNLNAPRPGARLPPMTSPGLLIPTPSSSGLFKGAVDASTGCATPESMFTQAMAAAGYTTEGRTKRPHRGSSVQRKVGDMFDSNVEFTNHFPDLVPKNLWYAKKEKGEAKKDPDAPKPKSRTSLPDLLMRSLEATRKQSEKDKQQSQDNGSRKRQRPWQFSDMVPVSLTIPYPQSFVEKRLQYVKEVKEREKAIIAYQDAQEKITSSLDNHDDEGKKVAIKNPVKVPPIPSPPTPPPLSELKGFNPEQYEDQHPIYLPKGKQNLVAHLDKGCFHISEGRYFGLYSNAIADPHFVGANAPGISGINLSGGSGLATSSAAFPYSGGPAGASVLASSSVNASGEDPSERPPKKDSTKPKSSKKTASLPNVVKASKSKFRLKHVGPTPNATTSDLRKIMEEGGELAEKMKTCIIRAAVHASRSGKHGQSFLAPDGKAYPDVSKAFAAHAGLKPCIRCKNNKQGVSVVKSAVMSGLLCFRLLSNVNTFCLSCLSGLSLSTSTKT